MPDESKPVDIYDIYSDSLGLFGESAVAQGVHMIAQMGIPASKVLINRLRFQVTLGNALRLEAARSGSQMLEEVQESKPLPYFHDYYANEKRSLPTTA